LTAVARAHFLFVIAEHHRSWLQTKTRSFQFPRAPRLLVTKELDDLADGHAWVGEMIGSRDDFDESSCGLISIL